MITLEYITQLDRQDKLAGYKDHFALDPKTVYLDGNSLGALPKKVVARMQKTLTQEWGKDLITSWNKHHWIDLPRQIGAKLANVVGAHKDEVICVDTISTNLFKLLAMGLQLNPGRRKILSVADNFPTDLYMAQGLSALLGEERCESVAVTYEELEQSLDEQVAVLMLSHVDFRTGRILDLEGLTAKAQSKGVLVLWDLAHSAGVVPMALSASNVDFAVGCTYKYLNGGPGAPGFAYVARRHQGQVSQPLSGWMGHKSPFAFDQDYHGAEDISQLLCGTPPILSLSALDTALDVFEDVSLIQLREKSKALTRTFHRLLQQQQLSDEFLLISPQNPDDRGSQLAYRHKDAYAICQALIQCGVIGDFRAPDILRFGFSPLYISYQDLWSAVAELAKVMETGMFQAPEFQRQHKVT